MPLDGGANDTEIMTTFCSPERVGSGTEMSLDGGANDVAIIKNSCLP